MHAAVGAGIALISAASQLAAVDQTVIERHLLAMPTGGAGLIAIAVSGIVIGELILLAMLWRRTKGSGREKRSSGKRSR